MVDFNIYLHGALHGTFTDLHGLVLFETLSLPQLTQTFTLDLPKVSRDLEKSFRHGINWKWEGLAFPNVDWPEATASQE